MSAQVHNLTQGTPEWDDFRLGHFGASEAAAMLGLSPKVKRDELLRMKATGLAKEFSEWVQVNVLDHGHEVEALARPLVEEIIGSDLYPVTCSDGRLSASCDGLTFDDTTAFEHKQLSQRLVELLQRGEMPEEHMPQCQQVLMVTGAEKLIFVVSDGTRENLHFLWVFPDPEWFRRLRAGWAQFAIDLANYVYTPPAAPAPVGRAPEAVPALFVEVRGEVVASNLDEVKDLVLERIRSVNRDLKTDQDFADSAKARKWCEDIEERAAAAKQQALGQTATIDALFKALDEISTSAREVRLDLQKLEKARTEAINGELVAGAIAKFKAHVDGLNANMDQPYMPKIATDFAGVLKGLRSVTSKENAVNTELARAKIAADEMAQRILFNLRILGARPDMDFLFADKATIVLKPSEDLGVLVKLRISEHESAEAKRKDEAAAMAAAVAATPPAPDGTHLAATRPMLGLDLFQESAASNVVTMRAAPTPAPAPARTGVPTLRIGTIKERLQHMTVTAEDLRAMGFAAAGRERAAPLYHDDDFPAICDAIAAQALAAKTTFLQARATATA